MDFPSHYEIVVPQSIENDLAQLNANAGALAPLYVDIGGEANLSTYRTPDGKSLLDLCATSSLPNAALVLLNQGFSFHAAGNNLPPRHQWNHNHGYCGECSLIVAGLAYGQYMSQYDARELASGSQCKELLLGINGHIALEKMHLQFEKWQEEGANAFLSWIKAHVQQGHPVAIGVYMNQNQFFGTTDPDAGDDEYDHIVPITQISDNTIDYNDNGLWGDDSNPQYYFNSPLTAFPANREEANAPSGPIYSLSDETLDYGVAILGVNDLKNETFPVRILTNINDEPNEIQDHSEARPLPSPVSLLVCISRLTPGVTYNVYEYDDICSIPDSDFNNNSKGAKCTSISINSGSNYVFTRQITSDETIAFRVVQKEQSRVQE